ncbi:MAG: glycosyltransferase [Alphaproteobacteria bacterium]|nr:glycosyltransferase [Alphaproteobacteria bacterium]
MLGWLRLVGRPFRDIVVFMVGLPRVIKNLVAGPAVSCEPFAELSRGLSSLVGGGDRAAPDVAVILSRDPSDLDALIDLELLADGWRGEIVFVLLVAEKGRLAFAETIDPETLGSRLATSRVADRLRIFCDSPTLSVELEDLLSLEVGQLDRLEADDLAPSSSVADAHRPAQKLAVVIRPQWLFCGSNMVFANQISYLVERGFYVIEIIANDLFLGHNNPDDLTAYILARNRGSHAHRTLLTNMTVGLLPWARALRRNGRTLFSSSIAMRAVCLDLAELPASIGRVFSRRKPDIVVVNHCFNMKLAKRLFPGSRLVLESHDIQAEQSRLRNVVASQSAPNFDMDAALADEFALMRDAAWVVSLNEDESRFFAESGGLERITTIHPYLNDRKGLRPNGQEAPGSAPALFATRDRILFPEPFDILLVASRHAANIISMRWFIDEVFAPVLSGRPVTVTIVGGISDALTIDHPNVRCTGQVPDIGPYYSAAKLVALPVTSGAGIPIKTLEALTLGCAVTATAAAVRGLAANGCEPIPTFDDPRAFGEDILALVADPVLRKERARIGLELATHTYSRAEYFNRWDTVLANLGVESRPPS